MKVPNSIKEVNLLTPKPCYLDASVCAKTFYLIAEEWWRHYESYSAYSYKKFCLTEYCKWKKYAKLFERSC